jgi:hypothetical protein
VRELQAEAAAAVVLSRGDVLRMLLDSYAQARQDGAHASAIRAAELLGKELGMFCDQGTDVAPVLPPEVVERRAKARQLMYDLLQRIETEGPNLDRGPAAETEGRMLDRGPRSAAEPRGSALVADAPTPTRETPPPKSWPR